MGKGNQFSGGGGVCGIAVLVVGHRRVELRKHGGWWWLGRRGANKSVVGSGVSKQIKMPKSGGACARPGEE